MQALGKDVRELLALLEKHGVHYLIVGGFAVAAHRFPGTRRISTSSVDNARRLLTALDELGFGDVGLTEDNFTTPDLVISSASSPTASLC